jgi:hypothetical protein
VVKGTTKYGPTGGCSASELLETGLPAKRRESIAKYINQGLSQKTWSSYKTAERMWRMCEKENKRRLELPWGRCETLIFLDWLLTDRKVSAATASAYLAGIKKLHEIKGVEEPKIRSGLINQIIKGKKNEESVKKRNDENKGRLPVTLTVMKILKEAIRASVLVTEEKLLLWAVSTVAFHGAFRIHEILCTRETEYDPDFTLLEDDIRIKKFQRDNGPEGRVLQFAIKHPKEDKLGRVVMVDVYETGGPTCPAKAFCQWFDRRDKTRNKVLFRKNDGTPLTGRRFNSHLRSLLGPHIDYDKGKITAHSFRSGIPTLLGQLGHADEDIKSIGRWSSRAFEHYLKLPRTTRAQIAQKLGKL